MIEAEVGIGHPPASQCAPTQPSARSVRKVRKWPRLGRCGRRVPATAFDWPTMIRWKSTLAVRTPFNALQPPYIPPAALPAKTLILAFKTGLPLGGTNCPQWLPLTAHPRAWILQPRKRAHTEYENTSNKLCRIRIQYRAEPPLPLNHFQSLRTLATI